MKLYKYNINSELLLPPVVKKLNDSIFFFLEMLASSGGIKHWEVI